VDGLRAFAALMVMLRHYYMHVFSLGLPRWTDVAGLGYLGVHLFLLLSGFCVSWAYVGRASRRFELKDFAARRATRILPAYYVMLLITSLLCGRDVPGGPLWQLVTHVTMTHNLFPSTVLALNGAFWSLALECQLYLLFPVFLFGFRRVGLRWTLGLTLLCQTVYRVIVMRYGVDYGDETFVLPWGVLGRMFDFALGMFAATVVAKGTLLRWPSLAKRTLPWLAALVCVGARFSKSRLGVTHPLTDLAWTLGFLGLVLAASLPATWLNRLLSWRLAVWLGTISYSAYLLHAVVIGKLARLALAWTGNRSPVLLTLPVLASVILLSAAYYRLVEAPAIAFFRWRGAARPVVRPAVG
jgi:peptidoglycan/LPS O-acetylase OafA/YrhL